MAEKAVKGYLKVLIKSFQSLILIFAFFPVRATELRWDGDANDGLWQNPLNWSSNILPGLNDDIVFDNTFITSPYVVSLGPGTGPVNLRSLRITPSGSNNITVIISPTNVENPALKCSGTVFGLVMDPGAIFINESGASSGSTIEIADSIRINNGGRYVHRTARSHAETVRSLSRAPGTEQGEFEFHIPVASSTISLSGQVFGRLRLSPGPNGIINYTGTGTNGLTIRSDLEIMPGVNLSLNLEGRLAIGGNLVHNGGILNLASTARKLVMELGGHFHQAASAITTETGTAQPEIVLNGNKTQELEIKGNIINEVSLKINNPAGVVLLHRLSLPYKLNLENGILTTNEHMVTLQSACQLEIAPQANNCFINGKLEKKGLVNASFQFPVGKNGARRWVQLHEATGDFVIEYMHSDPRVFSSSFGDGISHISALEYWSISGNGINASSARIELSFDHVNSGGVTDLSNLRVAWLNGQSWQDAGNSATTGTAGSSGSVSSQVQNWLGNQQLLYALASNTAIQNPLPITWKSFSGFFFQGLTRLEWIAGEETVAYYKVERSADASSFRLRDIVRAKAGSAVHQYSERVQTTDIMQGTDLMPGADIFPGTGIVPGSTPLFYRVVMIKDDSTQSTSKTIRIEPGGGSRLVSGNRPKPATVFLSASVLKVDFLLSSDAIYVLTIIDVSGRVIYRAKAQMNRGSILLPVNLPGTRGTNVFIKLSCDNGNMFTLKAMVQ
jgi:hypothetical protein